MQFIVFSRNQQEFSYLYFLFTDVKKHDFGMKISLFAFFLFTLFNSSGLGQNRQEADSLRHELAIAKQDTNRVLILVELAINYQNANPDSAMLYGKQSLDLAQKITFLRGQARAYHSLAIINSLIGDMSKGFDLVFKSLQIAEENNLPYEAARCHNLLGFFFSSNLGDDLKAMEEYRRGLAIIKTAPNSREKLIQEAQILRNIGNVYREKKKLESASSYYRQALKIQREANLKITSTQINNLGRIEFLLGHPDKAIEYSRQAIRLCKNDNDHRFASLIYNTLATYFKDLNQRDSAIYYSKIGLTEAQDIDFKDGLLRNSRLFQ